MTSVSAPEGESAGTLGHYRLLEPIGTGGMGSGMAANLLKAGHKLTITDLRREQCKGLESQGAVFRESPKALRIVMTPSYFPS